MDTIADLLTRIRNASQARLRYTTIPGSKLKVEMTRVLEEEGYIVGFRLIRDTGQGKIKVALKYSEKGEPAVQGLKRISKPGKRVYAKIHEIPYVRESLGTVILSTPQGVVTGKAARKLRTGGEILAYVW